MSTPVPGRPDPREPAPASGPADRASVAAEQATLAADQAADAADKALEAAEESAEVEPERMSGGSADVLEVPVVAVPVPVEAGPPWTGTVIEAVPTTADEIAALVLAVPDVVRLHAGRFGEVATYLPGRRVTGVKLGDDVIEVHVVIAGRVPVRQSAQAIHEAVASVVATPVHVFVEDVAA